MFFVTSQTVQEFFHQQNHSVCYNNYNIISYQVYRVKATSDQNLRNVTARITQITRQLDGTGWQSDSHHLSSAFLICRALSVIRVNCYLALHLIATNVTTNSKQPQDTTDFRETSWKHQPSLCGFLVIRHFSKKRPFLEVAAWEHGTFPGFGLRFTWNSSWYLGLQRMSIMFLIV